MNDVVPVDVAAASLAQRAGALALDAVLVAAATVVWLVLLLIGGGIGRSLLLLAAALTPLLLAILTLHQLATQGQSIGKRVIGIAVVDVESMRPVGWGRVIVRQLVLAVTGTVIIGYLSPLFDNSGRRRGWHDLAAGTVVVPVGTVGSPAHSADQAVEEAAAYPAVAGPQPVRAAVPAHAEPLGPSVSTIPPLPSVTPLRSPPPPPTFQPTPQPAGSSAAADPSIATGSAATGPWLAPASTTSAAADAMSNVSSGRAIISVVPGPDSVPSAPQAAAASSTAGHPLLQDSSWADASPEDDLASTRARPPVLELVLENGSRRLITGISLVGRDPEAASDELVDQLIAVDDPSRSLSKTHLAIGADVGGSWVVDRHSTNGTTVETASGSARRCPPGQRVLLQAGDVVVAGDRRLTIRARGG